jgi:lysine/ornithine N-monooxygenase
MLPAVLADLPRTSVFIADDLGTRLPAMSDDKDAPVAVIGGGQTGCEAVLRLVGAGFTRIQWIGRSQWFRTIDDSPVANEFYRPEYQQFLQGLSAPTRRRLIEEHEHTGDALTPGGMKAVYQANYDGLLATDRFPVQIHLGHEVVDAEPGGEGVVLHCKTAEQFVDRTAQYIVVAVGREPSPIPFDDDLRERVDLDDHGGLHVDADYSVRWKGMNGHRMYALNRARFSHGIPDANLTLLPVRAAIVLNSMFDREVYRLDAGLNPVTWG